MIFFLMIKNYFNFNYAYNYYLLSSFMPIFIGLIIQTLNYEIVVFGCGTAKFVRIFQNNLGNKLIQIE